jgi:tape measure domain-containing protein
MSSTVGAANIRLGALVSGFVDGMKQASKEVQNLTYATNTQLTSAFKKADTQAKVFRGGITRLGNEIEGLGKKMSTVVSLPIVFGGTQAFKEFANLQRLKIGLDQYGESIETVKKLAKLPNVGIEGAAQSLIQLRAVGVESKLAQRGITAFANALTAAGKSSIDLNPALTNIVQMLSTGVVSAVDVKELANRIPQARKALVDAFGTASGEALTKIGPEKVVMGLIEQLENIKPVAGGAAMAMEKFGDSFRFGMATIGESIDKTFGVTQKIDGLAESIGKATDGFAKMSPEVQGAALKFGILLAAIGPALIAIAQLIKLSRSLAGGLALVGGPVTLVTATIVTAIVYQKEIVKWYEKSAMAYLKYANIIRSNPITSWMTNDRTDKMAMGVLGAVAQDNKAASLARGAARRDQRRLNESAKGGGVPPVPKLEEATEATKALTAAEREMKMIDLSMKWQKDQDALKAKIKEYKELFGVTAGLNVQMMKLSKPSGSTLGNTVFDGLKSGKNKTAGIVDGRMTETLRSITEPIERAREKFQQLKQIFSEGWSNSDINKFLTELPQKAGESFGAYKERVSHFVSVTEQLNQALVGVLRETAASVATGFGEMLGDLASGVNGVQSFSAKLLGALGNMLKEMGKAMIAAGVGAIALKKLMSVPALAVAAGVALVAVGQVVTNSVNKSVEKAGATRFAKGGFAYGEMSAIVGDNPGSRFDPEMIAPFSKVDNSIRKSIKESGGGGGMVYIPEVTLRGEDIRIAFNRASENNRALTGRK